MTTLPPYTPPDLANAIQPWPRCSKCESGDLLVEWQPAGYYYGLRAEDVRTSVSPNVGLPEHLLRTCGTCGYYWREALAVGS